MPCWPGKFPARFDVILADIGIQVVLSGIQMPRMNSIMERWYRPVAMSYSTAPSSGTSDTCSAHSENTNSSITATDHTQASPMPTATTTAVAYHRPGRRDHRSRHPSGNSPKLPGAMRMAELATASRMSRRRLSHAVDSLERRGLVTRGELQHGWP